MRCDSTGGRIVCSQGPVTVTRTVAIPAPDLEDPEVLAIALSKASAVARSLKTTNGRILDVTNVGPVAASLERIAMSADEYRGYFATNAYSIAPEKLGVMSTWGAMDLDHVANWDGDRLPTFESAIELKQDSLKQVAAGEQFKITRGHLDLITEQLNMNSMEHKMELK